MSEKQCVICGEFFKTKRNPNQKCCSRKCNAIYQNKIKEFNFKPPTCLICGKETRRESRAKYCSAKCQGVGHIGEKNPMWKGGITVSSGGYKMILRYDHPFSDSNSRIQEHRIVIEKWLNETDKDSKYLVPMGNKRYLRFGVVIHHINGNKKDNRLENLEILDNQAQHLKKHLDSRNQRQSSRL